MPLETLFANPTPPVERSKSILSRFSSPLTKRSGKIFDFEIEPEHPHKTYKPGDSVKGQIVLSVFKGFEITHLTISLHGFARVFKHQATPGDHKNVPEQLVNGKGSHGFEYHGNGLASLFQDEQALCGSGFLKKQVYKFGFELQFPSYSLPSTIEFERGAVRYMISATVTRPTAITPTTSRTCKVAFEDRIDIEPMCTPKSRAIYLEPMRRGGKVKKVKQSSSTGTQENTASQTLSRQSTSQSIQTRSTSTAPLQNPPLSPAPSEDTIATNATASTHSLKLVDNQSSQRKESDNSEPRSSTTSNSAHTISATTEITRHGALPGEQIPVRVKVEHTKAIRGIVIATLYRQGRIDLLPAIPLVSKTKDKKPEYEDVYPKSRTGLGGLYFTNGTPNMVFRMDLTQTSTMMIIDPHTKTADVRFSVKVPNEAFPTMDNIPGGMISFTYHIEVVIDLTGKLGESRLLPSLTTNGPSFSKSADGGNQLTHDWASNILDTAPLRRTKNVAAFELPLIVGTEDSGKWRRSQEARQYEQAYHNKEHEHMPGPEGYDQRWQQSGYDDYSQRYGYQGYDAYNDGWYDEHGNPMYDPWYDHHLHPPSTNDPLQHSAYHQHHVPPPQGEEHLDEKSRLRRQEELLLPSQPPDAGEPSSRAQALAPSAPALDGETSLPPGGPQASIPITISRASARSGETIVPTPLTPPPSLPEDEQIARPTEDKQELERQRLLAQASAPPTDDDHEAGPSSSGQVSAEAPSAPVIDEEEEYIVHALQSEARESLPRYQR
ncbi:ph-response sensor protein [Knufia fluminis]|uniref:Ph-response sensor protein n=1 Tax=Knufia fluminis TaxID=191047 RepID=A0AAN8EKC8_9EURO|nr:ph-response sensor protein [Knufia fluminis]